MKVAYHLAGGLSSGQTAACRDMAKSILSQIGLRVDHDEILAFLGKQPGVRVQGNRVCYSEELFEQCLEQQRAQNADYVWQEPDEPDYVMRPAYMCLNVYDPIDDRVTRATTEDLVRAVKLCDSYEMAGTAPVHPQNLPEPLRQVGTAKLCVENSRAVGKWIVAKNIDEIRCITAMSKLAGRKPPYVVLQITISPMKLNVEYLDIVWRLRGSPDFADGITIGGGAIPMLGATGPLSLPAAWAQAAAEAIGAYITVKLIDPRVLSNLCFQVFPFDMRTVGITMGTPEGALARLTGKQIQQELFGRTLGSSFASMGLPLDPQSTAEKMANLLVEALAGARVFYDAGLAPIDDMFCLEQVILDREIMLWIKRFMTGLEFEGDAQTALDAIREGIEEGQFFTQPWTLRHREFYWQPELFSYQNLSGWLAGPRKHLAERARGIVQSRLSSHEFALPSDVAAEIERVYRKAEQTLR